MRARGRKREGRERDRLSLPIWQSLCCAAQERSSAGEVQASKSATQSQSSAGKVQPGAGKECRASAGKGRAGWIHKGRPSADLEGIVKKKETER